MKKNMSLWKRVSCFALAFVMVVSVFTVVATDTVKANDFSFKGKGTSTVTITDEQCTYLSGVESYISFKPGVTGYVTVTASNSSVLADFTMGDITLCNGKKQPLSQSDVYSTAPQYSKACYHTMTYGVQKGKQYYFKVNSDAGVTLKATVKAQKKTGGKTRKKAKTIAKNKAMKGVIIAGDKKAEWFKIKVTKKQKVKLTLTAKSNGNNAYNGIKVSFYDKKGKLWTSDSYLIANRFITKDAMTFQMIERYSRKTSGIAPGTYFIKVERYNNTSSGYYQIKWK